MDRSGTHFGFGITPWAGYYVMPYYTYTFTFGGPTLHEMGTYFKIFISGEGGGASHDDDWD